MFLIEGPHQASRKRDALSLSENRTEVGVACAYLTLFSSSQFAPPFIRIQLEPVESGLHGETTSNITSLCRDLMQPITARTEESMSHCLTGVESSAMELWIVPPTVHPTTQRGGAGL